MPKAVRVAAGLEVPKSLEVLDNDGLEWLSPWSTRHVFTMNLDEGSGLVMVTSHGQVGDRSSNRTSDELVQTWRDWVAGYRHP